MVNMLFLEPSMIVITLVLVKNMANVIEAKRNCGRMYNNLLSPKGVHYM